jgi:hypothetical protein
LLVERNCYNELFLGRLKLFSITISTFHWHAALWCSNESPNYSQVLLILSHSHWTSDSCNSAGWPMNVPNQLLVDSFDQPIKDEMSLSKS